MNHQVRLGEGRAEGPGRPANIAFTGPTLLCPLGLTQFLWFQVPLFESSTCELEQPGGSQGESARRFGQNPEKRALRKLDYTLPITAPHTFGGSMDALDIDSLLGAPATSWAHACKAASQVLGPRDGKGGEDLRGAGLSRGEGTEWSDPHVQSGQLCWSFPVLLPGPISPQSDSLPSPLFTLCIPISLSS